MQGGAGPIQWVGPVRPAIHYSPAATWLNDPNGLIFHNSLWHLYYQTNPHGLTWGNMSWGHATSPDLAHWTEHETAISYDDAEALACRAGASDSPSASAPAVAHILRLSMSFLSWSSPHPAVPRPPPPSGRRAPAVAYAALTTLCAGRPVRTA